MPYTPAQKKAYKKALQTPVKAVAFDVDGTLTNFCRFTIPNTLVETLNEIPLHIPLAICTGRPVDFIKGKIDQICGNFTEQRERWYVIAENGGAGYVYNSKTGKYDEFFKAAWPEEIISRVNLCMLLKDGLGRKAPMIHKRDFSVVITFQKWFYYTFYSIPKLIQSRSAQMVSRVRIFLSKTPLHTSTETLADHFKVLDSGLGSLILPMANGKGAALKHWAKHLGISLDELVCIGDRPDPGGNDEDMMTGETGHAFTAGHLTENIHPLPVFTEDGKRLIGPAATEAIVERLKFA
jgi:HAD superfamily hydrolase (TIGR01484 family)